MENFTVKGTIKLKNEIRGFEKTVSAPSENAAREKIYCEFGSKNGKVRSQIEIREVKKG